MSVTRFISAVLLGLLAFAVPVFAEIPERNSDTGSFKIGFREGAPPTSFTSEADETAFQFTVAQELGTAPPLTPTERHAEQDFVPTETCAGCHPAQHQAWLRSHHRHAMEPATDETVLGNFDDSTITHRGLTTRFFRRDGRFIVETEGPDGKRGEFEIVYTFGFEPLQQYLIKMAGGKLQALTISWDTTTKRWFHLYPELDIEPGNTLHWTGAFNNWNFTCAACHSTNLKKSYDRSQDVYSMSWSAINVGCQACHGAGGAHVEWAKGEHAQDSANGGSLLRHRRLADRRR